MAEVEVNGSKKPSERKKTMKITSVEVAMVRIPLVTPIFYRKQLISTLESLILTLRSENGMGQAEASGTVLPQIHLPALAQVLETQVVPRLVGKVVSNAGESLRECLGVFAENRVIFGLAEMAWWNLDAAEKGISTIENLGLEPVSQQVFTSLDHPVPNAEGLYEIDTFLERIAKTREEGYVHWELKVRPGWDLPMVRFVRQEFPDLSFHIDVEGGMTPEQTDILLQMRDFFPRMIEQPYEADAWRDLAELQELLPVVCLDESITSQNVARTAVEWNVSRCLKVNPLRVGGFAAAKEIVAYCRESKVECWISSPLQTAVGVHNTLAISCLDGVTGPFEYYAPQTYFDDSYSSADYPPLTHDEEGNLRILC